MQYLLQKLTELLKAKHHCHTVILYGSFARDEANEQSDIDIMGVSEGGEKVRDAWTESARYIDLFVWPQGKLEPPTPEHVYMADGVVLWEEKSWGTAFLSQLKEILQKGPEPLAESERKVRKLWMKKMLDRARAGDLEGAYRRSWLQTTLLEDYFSLRGKWFLGSRKAFAWLAEHDKRAHELFSQSLLHSGDLKALERLVENISGES